MHTDAAAGRSADAVNAAAYTAGRHLVFGPDRYRPASPAGRRLLAHELAHVVQQARGGPATPPLARSPTEQAADRASSAFDRPGTIAVAGAAAPGLARVVAPRSLSSHLDPASLSDPELDREISLLTHWVEGNKSTAPGLVPVLAALRDERARRPPATASTRGREKAAGGATAAFRIPLPPVAERPGGATESVMNPPAADPHKPREEYRGPTAPPPARPAPGGRADDREAAKPSPAAKAPATAAATPAAGPVAQPPSPAAAAADQDEAPVASVQTGIGVQANLRDPHQPFRYMQISAEWSNKFVLPTLGPKELGPNLSRYLKSVHLLGEPGLTLQTHNEGYAPGQQDLQFLAKLVQASLTSADVSVVAGLGINDTSKWPSADRTSLLLGLEGERKLRVSGPVEVSFVVDALAYRNLARSGRADAQLSGELRLTVHLP